jgi:hypothetical protein
MPALLGGLLLCGACGGEMEVLLEIAQGGNCWQPAGTFASAGIFVADQKSSSQPSIFAPRSFVCHEPAQPVALTPSGVSAALGERGSVASGVDADRPSWIVIVLHKETGCSSTPLVCLMSEPVPPAGQKERVSLSTFCPVVPPDPQFTLCVSVLPPP